MNTPALLDRYRLQERRGPQIGMTSGYEQGVWRYDFMGQDFCLILDHNLPLDRVQSLITTQKKRAKDHSTRLEWK
ncbi:MAG: hypothetical protein HOH02_09720 [Oceanospirillaceae bacterium]|jgi:hypothetical protein|nr:hypothetical protein [Oceanospirillaceae bacterium]MBT4444140.1 hypothetical protein [Oceanospirillaceae bacterium]MBT6078222.1 hypothetical protein [Oceanospirillaceae bacterium]MBT7331249.1 hypothetical protein [Oceanospirillaceae bacterium]